MAEKPINEIRLRFPSLSVNERFARLAISGFVGLYDPRIDDLNDIKTAVSEAVTNCIVHAYRGTVGEIELTAKAYSSGLIYIRIKDKGCGIEDVKKAMEPLFTTQPDGERSGLGFSVMESFCDRVDVKKAMEPLFTTQPDGERSGLGFSVMESFCDRVDVKSKPGAGTTVVLCKKLRSKLNMK